MDVSAITSGTGTPAPAVSGSPVDAKATAPTPTPQTANVDSSSAPAPAVQTTQPQPHNTLAPAVAKIFAPPSVQEPAPLDVSYRILKGGLGEIVTVFTNPETGREVAQFPPEILIGLATFFDQQSGATLDTNA